MVEHPSPYYSCLLHAEAGDMDALVFLADTLVSRGHPAGEIMWKAMRAGHMGSRFLDDRPGFYFRSVREYEPLVCMETVPGRSVVIVTPHAAFHFYAEPSRKSR